MMNTYGQLDIDTSAHRKGFGLKDIFGCIDNNNYTL